MHEGQSPLAFELEGMPVRFGVAVAVQHHLGPRARTARSSATAWSSA
jgi:hypothetical protein